jgi:hypothetical protein
MPEPDISNKAQQSQEAASAADLKKPGREADAVGARLKPGSDGAVHGGEETKPGQMDGDEDIAPNAPQTEIEKAVRNQPRAGG